MTSTWDLVVFTTMDASQNLAFGEAICSHKRQKFFEKCDFRVYVDDENDNKIKLGSGGATLMAIRRLFMEYGKGLFQKRILMIPVGGYSQRLPNCSALGKVFLELPTAGYPTTILDLKLGIYNKFLPYLPPGMLLAASDTVEYYADLAANLPTPLFNRSGFTLFTFRSSLQTAQNHGVFVLNREKISRYDNAVEKFHDIRKVLQKPTLQELESENAVIEGENDYAYIDGLYFIASDVVEEMNDLTNNPDFEIRREICAYADFLRPLGKENNSDYAQCKLQQLLYDHLRDFPAIALHFLGSKFFHLGTLRDTLDHFCNLESNFARTFNLCKFSNVILSNVDLHYSDSEEYPCSIECCAISSIINGKSFIPKLSLIENCHFMTSFIIPEGNVVVLSNACLNCETDVLRIDHSIFATTIPIHCDKGLVQYVTIAFDVFEDYKKEVGNRKIDDVTVISSEQQWENIFPHFKTEIAHSCVIGFDCEWVEVSNWNRLYEKKEIHMLNWLEKSCAKQDFEKHIIRIENTRRDRVSLLQISAVSGYTLLIRLILFKNVPDSLKTFLEDARIIKVGVNIFSDCSRLHKDWGILVNSWLDMRFLVNDLPNCKLSEPIRNGLKAMGEVFCNETVRYSDKMRYSNWCGIELDHGQIHYASQDSKIAIESFVQLMQEYLRISKKEKCAIDPKNSEFWKSAHHLCGIHLNCKFDHDRFMSIKTGGTGQSKKRKGREEPEDSNSDLDLDMSCLNTDDFKCDEEKILKFKMPSSKDVNGNDDGTSVFVMAPNFLIKQSENRGKYRVMLNGKTYLMTYLPTD